MDEGLDQLGANELGALLSGLWSDEGCSWRIDRLDDAEFPWYVTLKSTTEGGDHHADETSVAWYFNGDSIEVPLADAVEWCRGLLPFRHCRECDGRGEYGGPGGVTVSCEDCGGTGRDPEGKTW